MNKVVATLYLFLALSDSISASSLPSTWSDYFRNIKEERVLTQQSNGAAAVCEAVSPASIACQSADTLLLEEDTPSYMSALNLVSNNGQRMHNAIRLCLILGIVS